MRRNIVCGFAALLCLNSVVAADPHWSRMASAHFEMYTTASERSARDTLRYFEQVHSVFAQAMPPSTAQPSAVRILAFSSQKEYEPYRLNEFATAFYRSAGDRDYIVMSHTGAETFPIAVHEYVHLVVRHANVNLPPWLNEGLAELYSTLQPSGDKLLVGSLIAGRYHALLRDDWVPLQTILEAGHDSPYYNEKNKAGSLYNEGWALTHMLVLSPDYRPKFSQFTHLIAAGVDSAAALEQTYRVPLSQIESELKNYLRGGRFRGVLLPIKLEKVDDDLKAEPADAFEVKLLLAEIGDRAGREETTRAALQGLIAENPKRSEPHVDLGYLDRRERRSGDARQEFAKAFELGGRSPRMLWDCGRMVEAADQVTAIDAFREVLKQEPDRVEVRLELASVQLRAHPQDALATLAQVNKVTTKEAPRMFTLLAYASLGAGNRSEARAAAERLKGVATNDEDRAQADQILQFLDHSEGGVAPALPEGQPGVVRRRYAGPFAVRESADGETRPSYTGGLVDLECEAQTTLIIDTAEGKKRVLVEDPGQVVVQGVRAAEVNLVCGPQKARPIRVEYDPASQFGIDGVARVIHFGEH
jgi:hypothetical protein